MKKCSYGIHVVFGIQDSLDICMEENAENKGSGAVHTLTFPGNGVTAKF